jgi:hypothetical protein
MLIINEFRDKILDLSRQIDLIDSGPVELNNKILNYKKIIRLITSQIDKSKIRPIFLKSYLKILKLLLSEIENLPSPDQSIELQNTTRNVSQTEIESGDIISPVTSR